MARRSKDVTDAELAVLRVLWREEASAVREIAEEIYGHARSSECATVQKLLERLEAKGFVARRRGEGPQRYRARVGRDELLGRRLRETADALCDGSLTPLLTQLVRTRDLSDEDRAMLRGLIDELDGAPEGGGA
ncbi:MAG: BlaI/MecI/CopY family transcriptional regulator [Planctomycetota bacterium]